MEICDPNIVLGVQIDYANSWSFEVNVSLCNCGNVSEELKHNRHIPGNESKSNYFPGDNYHYYAITDKPWDAALASDRTAQYKMWKKSMMLEIPALVMMLEMSHEIKPEIHFFEFVQSDGGFIAGHFNITFRKPHWDNPDRFIDAMGDLCSKYDEMNETEGVFGYSFPGYEKRVYTTHKLEIWDPEPELDETTTTEDPLLNAEASELTEEELKEQIKKLRAIDNPVRLALLPVALIVLISVLGYMLFKSRACMLKTWC